MAAQGTNDNGSGRNKTRSEISNQRTKTDERGNRNRYAKPAGKEYSKTTKYSKSGDKAGSYENRSYSSRYNSRDKDEDEDDVKRRSKPSRPKDNKSSVAVPDKNKAMLRLEKEQKSMKKKQSKKKESSRPQPKVKRANNINYTRSYANGDYDDYDDYI